MQPPDTAGPQQQSELCLGSENSSSSRGVQAGGPGLKPQEGAWKGVVSVVPPKGNEDACRGHVRTLVRRVTCRQREGTCLTIKKCADLAGWLSWLVRRPIHQKVAGSIPGQGMYLGCEFDPQSGRVWEATNQYFSPTSMFLSLSLHPPFVSLKSMNIPSSEDEK